MGMAPSADSGLSGNRPFLLPDPGPLDGVKTRNKARCDVLCSSSDSPPVAFAPPPVPLLLLLMLRCHARPRNMRACAPAHTHIYIHTSFPSAAYPLPTTHVPIRLPIHPQVILRADDIAFTYPGAPKPSLKHVSVRLCLASRVAIVGANGAGKTTLLKMLVGETEQTPGIGELWRHHNLRVSYVAQHSMHHLEEQQNLTPLEYIQSRFFSGRDREDMLKSTIALTPEEEAERAKRGSVEAIVGAADLCTLFPSFIDLISALFRPQISVIRSTDRGVCVGISSNIPHCQAGGRPGKNSSTRSGRLAGKRRTTRGSR